MDLKIFVVHYDKLIERKQFMIEQIHRQNLNCEFISNHGKDILTTNDVKMFKNISSAEISCALHHIECFKEIAEKYDYALILEDDVILCDDFAEKLKTYLTQLPPNWDMLFIGDGCNLHIPDFRLIKNQYIYKKENFATSWGGNGATRCLDSYMITKRCCHDILQRVYLPNYIIDMPADHWLNKVIQNYNFNIYWTEPTITRQGSELNIYKSSIR
jgi:GR25 family glycosyltransferase involved in LPS biosynthesis